MSSLLFTSVALAAGGPKEASASGRVAILVGMVGLAYFLASFVVNRLQRRFLFVSGLEYILLGLLLGPAVAGTLTVFDDLGRLAPIIAFAAGWIGLVYGTDFEFKALVNEGPGNALRLAFAEVLGTGGLVMIAAFGFFRSGWLTDPLPMMDSWCAAGLLGCAAAAGSSSAVDLLSETYSSVNSRLLPLLRKTSRFGDILAIMGLGVLFAVFHQPSGESAQLAGDPAVWILATGLLGVLMGFLFSAFLADESDEHSRFLALVGVIVLTAGTSIFLEISMLTVNLALGVILVNLRGGPAVAETLERSLKPATLVLMVFAGAMWKPVDLWAGIAVCVGYLLLRGFAKGLVLMLATLGTPMRKDLFRGLMAQGDVAIAMAVTFRLIYGGPAAELAYTAILFSVMLNELVAPRLVKGLLIDAGELDSDATAWGARA